MHLGYAMHALGGSILARSARGPTVHLLGRLPPWVLELLYLTL